MGYDDAKGVKQAINAQINKFADKIVFSQHSGADKHMVREVGDTWTDAEGQTWIQKQGYADKVTKIDRSLVLTPTWCPECQRVMNHKLHVKFYRTHGKCHDCVILSEDKLRASGEWKQYEEKKMILNQMAWMRDKMIELAAYLTEVHKPEFQIWDEDRAAFQMTEKWDVPLDDIKRDIGNDLVIMNKNLQKKEEYYREKYGPVPGIDDLVENDED